jgi:oligopeptidase B
VTATPPSAKRVDHRREYHGDVFNDPYEWMRDKSDPDVIAYLEAENSYTEQITDHLAPLRQKIFDEIKARTKETDLSVPARRDQWWYYSRSFEGKQYSVHCRCPIAGPDDWTPPELDQDTEIHGEQVLLDENLEAEGHTYFALGAATVSIDAHTLAYSVDIRGDERYTLRFKDLRTGQHYDDEIVGIGAGATWAADNRTVYYTTVDDAWRPDTVWRHRIGSGLPAEKVYHEPDEKFWLAVGRTRRSVTPTPPMPTPSSFPSGRAATSSSTPSSTPSSAARTASSSCTTTAPRTSCSSRLRSVTPPRRGR